MCVLIHERPKDLTLADKVLTLTRLELQKSLPTYNVSQKLGGPFLRLSIPRERLSIPPGSWWGGKNTGWLVTWDCLLRTVSAFWKSLESFIQLSSFCNSCILPVSSRIVSRSLVIQTRRKQSLPLLPWSTDNDWLETSFRQESDKLVYGPNTQHERMKMTHEMMWNVPCARQTWAWATHVRVIRCE